MRRRVIAGISATAFTIVMAAGAAAPAFATKPTPGDLTHKVTFCHATHSETNPYVIITTDKIGVLQAHIAHQDLEDAWPSFEYWDENGEVATFDGHTVPGAPGDCGGVIG